VVSIGRRHGGGERSVPADAPGGFQVQKRRLAACLFDRDVELDL
jgi:hypothetical protein